MQKKLIDLTAAQLNRLQQQLAAHGWNPSLQHLVCEFGQMTEQEVLQHFEC